MKQQTGTRHALVVPGLGLVGLPSETTEVRRETRTRAGDVESTAQFSGKT